MKFLGNLLQFIDGRLTGIKKPVNDEDAANKKYVDDSVFFQDRGILPTSDLNTVTTPGIYELSVTNDYGHAPVTTLLFGTLIVLVTGTRVLQILHAFTDTPTTKTWDQVLSNRPTSATHVRTRKGTIWSTWL